MNNIIDTCPHCGHTEGYWITERVSGRYYQRYDFYGNPDEFIDEFSYNPLAYARCTGCGKVIARTEDMPHAKR